MKLNFKILILVMPIYLGIMGQKVFPAEFHAILITFNQHYQTADKIEEILRREVKIPERLIEKQWSAQPCEVNKRSVVHLCVNKQGKMVVAYTNNKILKRSFMIFQRKAKN